MGGLTSSSNSKRTAGSARNLAVRVESGQELGREAQFSQTFTIGSDPACDLALRDAGVAPQHVQVMFDGVLWWARDLGSAAGCYVDGTRIQLVPVSEALSLELGKGGPLLVLSTPKERVTRTLRRETRAAPRAQTKAPLAAPPEAPPARFSSETQIIQRYLRPSGQGPVGRETLMFQRAFARVQRKSALRYQILVLAVLLALGAAAVVIAYQARNLRALRATAEKVFYAAKALEIENARLEEYAQAHAEPGSTSKLLERRGRLEQMEKEYDAFVQKLGVYDKVPEDERLILKVARTFGECEVNIPKSFFAEVRRYVQKWKSTDRLAKALSRARDRGYAPFIINEFTKNHLPPQFFFLALQESNFDEFAMGPSTRYGYAKGMWQFIAPTANEYQLRVGPLSQQRVYDPQDDRFDWRKATAAAARYISDLNSTDAQASGLLVMASYNWGHGNVRNIIKTLPENPQERNFWRLLTRKNVPAETYDYVLSIFSAAVICENPRLFGFDGACPSGGGIGDTPGGSAASR